MRDVLERGLPAYEKSFARKHVIRGLSSGEFLKFRQIGSREIVEVNPAKMNQIVEFVLYRKISPELACIIEGCREYYGKV